MKQIYQLCLLLVVILSTILGAATGEMRQPELSVEDEYWLLRAQMISTLGVYDQWPLEDKARLDAFRLKNGMINDDGFYRTLPSSQDLTQEEALAIAKATICEKFQLEDNALINHTVAYNLMACVDQSYPRFWHITLSLPEATGTWYEYQVEIESLTKDAYYCYSEEHFSDPSQGGKDVPDSNDITEEEAVANAQKAVHNYLTSGETIGRNPLSREMIDLMDINVGFCLGCQWAERSWHVGYSFNDTDLFEHFYGFLSAWIRKAVKCATLTTVVMEMGDGVLTAVKTFY